MDRPFDHPPEYPPFASLPSNVSGTFQGLPLEPGSALPGSGELGLGQPGETDIVLTTSWVGFVHHDYHFQRGSDMRSWPSSSTLSVAANSITSDSSEVPHSPFVRGPPGPTTNGDFAPFPASDLAHISPTAPNPHAFNYAQPRNDAFWQQQPPPLRSMSFPHIDGMNNSPSPYDSAFQRSPMPHVQYSLHPLDVRSTTSAHHQTEPQSAPVSGQDMRFGPPQAYLYQQQLSGVANPAVLQSHGYQGGWYPEQAPFVQYGEEADNSRPDHHRPV
jgi:hypothetical protein